MAEETVKGVDVKVTGECSLVKEILEILTKTCEVVHASRVIYHDHDDGCHKFLSVSGVNPDE